MGHALHRSRSWDAARPGLFRGRASEPQDYRFPVYANVLRPFCFGSHVDRVGLQVVHAG